MRHESNQEKYTVTTIRCYHIDIAVRLLSLIGGGRVGATLDALVPVSDGAAYLPYRRYSIGTKIFTF